MQKPGAYGRRWRKPAPEWRPCWERLRRKSCLLPEERRPTNAAFRQMAREGKGVTVLSTDHDASLKTSVALGNGRMCSVDSEGRAVPEEWEALCAGEAGGVSFAWANNETGVLQDAAALCAGARRHGLPCIWMRCSVPERFPCACMGWMWIMRPFPPINCMVRRV